MSAEATLRMDRIYRHQRHIYDLSRKFYLLGRDRLIRVGARYPGEKSGRLTPDGRDIPGDSEENKTVERIERPGPGFGD